MKRILFLSFFILSLGTGFATADHEQGRADSYLDMAKKYSAQHEYQQAIKWYKEAIKLNPDDARGYTDLGRVYLRMKNFPEAIKYYQEAIGLEPRNNRSYIGLGFVYQEMGDYPQATKCFRQSIILNPNDSGGYDGLGRVHLDIKDYEEALEYYKKQNVKINENNTTFKDKTITEIVKEIDNKSLKSFKKMLNSLTKELEHIDNFSSQVDKTIQQLISTDKLSKEDIYWNGRIIQGTDSRKCLNHQ